MSAGARPALHHLKLKTTRLHEMIGWYGNVLGTEVVHAFRARRVPHERRGVAPGAFLTTPALADDAQTLRHTGIRHVALEFASIGDLLATYVRLRDAGTTPHFAVDHGMSTSLYYVDRDGNSVELQVDNFGDWERSSEFMRAAPEFAAEPIGMPFDPEAYLAAHDAGATAEELHRRAYSGEFRSSAPVDPPLP